MEGLVIKAENLLSRQIRRVATNGQIRKLNFNFSLSSQSGGGGGGDGLIQRLFSWGGRLAGFVSGAIRSITWSATSIFGWLVARTTELSQFDWNATDAELLQAVNQRNIGVAASWGRVVGSGVGNVAALAIGVGVAYFVPVIGGAGLARAVASGAVPELLQEFGATMMGAVNNTAETYVRNDLTYKYINIRSAIKKLGAEKLTRIFGQGASDWITKTWGSQSAPRLTIADSIENSLQRAPGGAATQAFLQAATEEAFDSFIEGGFIMAAELDVQIASAKAANRKALGKERTVTVEPDRETNEKFYITGAEHVIKPQIQQVIHQARIVHNRDIGQIVGQPAEEWRRAKPHTKMVTVVMRDKKEPPWRHPDGRRCREATYAIPDLKAGVSWQSIKTAAKAYTWGKFRATANLSTGRQMAVYGATAQEAEGKLRDLLKLSSAEIVTMSISEEKERNRRLKKEPTRMYPAFVTTLIRRPTTDPDSGRAIGNQTYTEKNDRYELWRDQPPREFIL
jgi:hypothetical protein